LINTIVFAKEGMNTGKLAQQYAGCLFEPIAPGHFLQAFAFPKTKLLSHSNVL